MTIIIKKTSIQICTYIMQILNTTLFSGLLLIGTELPITDGHDRHKINLSISLAILFMDGYLK